MTSSSLSTLVTYNPWSVDADTTLDDAVRRLDQMGFHHWPVVDQQQRLIGLLSGTDIVRSVVERHTAAAAVAGGVKGDGPREACLVRHIMSPRVMTIDHNQSPKSQVPRERPRVVGRRHDQPRPHVGAPVDYAVSNRAARAGRVRGGVSDGGSQPAGRGRRESQQPAAGHRVRGPVAASDARARGASLTRRRHNKCRPDLQSGPGRESQRAG
jgi:hypothetical protein